MAPITSPPHRASNPKPRQVTPQPQEKAPDAGQPHVPHTRIQEPGEEEPESGRAPAEPAPE